MSWIVISVFVTCLFFYFSAKIDIYDECAKYFFVVLSPIVIFFSPTM